MHESARRSYARSDRKPGYTVAQHNTGPIEIKIENNSLFNTSISVIAAAAGVVSALATLFVH
jgi:hypothetical protein